ncbi:MAG: M20 family metallopeptidase [Clostridia bacterium]|nr:M20 family metallopeptidase [Clostridia bacterium]
MKEQGKALCAAVENRADELFAVACDIFDHPETGRQEYYACKTLEDYLKTQGFEIEHGIAGLDTAFKGTFERGQGGPTIGFMVEYDALKNVDHACGHHLQGPAGIGAALALRDVSDKAVKLVIYGTPDEEGSGGKIDMAQAGVFNDADLVFAYHSGSSTGISWENLALQGYSITFHGKKAHAAGAPYKGRSALDAALLMFHALEMMREHCTEGTRIHYTISEGTGPSNVVPDTCKVAVTLRNTNSRYLADMKERFADIIKGACLMTGTGVDVTMRKQYDSLLSLETPRREMLSVMEELGCENINYSHPAGRGSTDVGNVSWVAPTIYFHTYYTKAPAHTEEYAADGKKPCARRSMVTASQIAGLTALKCLNEPDYLAAIKAEYQEKIAE